MEISSKEYRKINMKKGMKKVYKYKNQSIIYAGLRFDSKKELKDWLVLLEKQSEGKIRNLNRQVSFELIPKQGKLRACSYKADFVWEEKDSVGGWKKVVGDTKSEYTRRLPVYIIKKKLMLERHGIEIREI